MRGESTSRIARAQADLQSNFADRLYCSPGQGLVNITNVLSELCGYVVGVCLISNRTQYLKLDCLDVRRLVLPAVEAGVDLQNQGP